MIMMEYLIFTSDHSFRLHLLQHRDNMPFTKHGWWVQVWLDTVSKVQNLNIKERNLIVNETKLTKLKTRCTLVGKEGRGTAYI